MQYSVRYLDSAGGALSTSLSTFETDALAITFAREQLPGNSIVEIWGGERLIARLYQNPLSQAAP